MISKLLVAIVTVFSKANNFLNFITCKFIMTILFVVLTMSAFMVVEYFRYQIENAIVFTQYSMPGLNFFNVSISSS